MRLASIDIGSNSVRYLVVEEDNGYLRYLASSSRITRITEGIHNGSTQLLDHAVSRTLNVLSDVIHELDIYGIPPENRYLFATESLRSASNSLSVVQRIEETAGRDMEVLTGEEEARRSFIGAVSSFDSDSLVFDLGGGSLELCSTNEGISVPLGVVRMTNMFGKDVGGLSSYINETLRNLDVGSVDNVIGVGGTSSAIAMMLNETPVKSYSPSLIHGFEIRESDLVDLGLFFQRPDTDPMKVIGLEPRRSDIILAGIITINVLMQFLGQSSYIHSETDLLWGSIIEFLKKREVHIEGITFQ